MKDNLVILALTASLLGCSQTIKITDPIAQIFPVDNMTITCFDYNSEGKSGPEAIPDIRKCYFYRPGKRGVEYSELIAEARDRNGIFEIDKFIFYNPDTKVKLIAGKVKL